MGNENQGQSSTSSGNENQQESTNAGEAPATLTALQEALKPVGEVLANVVGDLKEIKESRAAVVPADLLKDISIVTPPDQIDDATFYNQGPAKSAQAIAEAAIKDYHEKFVEPKQKRDEESAGVRLQRESGIAAKSIERLPNFADVKDKVYAAMASVKNPDTLTNPEAWKRAYAMEIGMRITESHEAKTTAALPVSEVGVTRESEGPSAEQVEVGRKLGLSKEDVEESHKMLREQDGRLLKVV